MEKLLPWRRPFTGIPGSRHESDSIFTPENHITQPPQCQKVECICVCKQFRVCLPGISVYQSFRLTFISDAEACGRAAVVCSEQQEQEVWCGNQEMRRLGTMVFADQERGCWGAIPDLQCVIVDFCLEPREKKNKKKKHAHEIHNCKLYMLINSNAEKRETRQYCSFCTIYPL